jgi:hypothetical protein
MGRCHNDSGAKARTPGATFRAPGVPILECLQPSCLCCASRTAALATIVVILLAVAGNAAEDATEEAAKGQWTSTAAGSLSGSLRTMTSSSVGVIAPRARTSLSIG